MKHLQHLQHVPVASFAQTGRQTTGQFRVDRSQIVEMNILISGTGQDQQLAVGCGSAPRLQLLQSVTPVAPTSEQPHHDQPCCRRGAAQIVIELGRVAEAVQRETADRSLEHRFRGGTCQHPGETGEIGAGTRQEEHIRRWLLHQHNVLRWIDPGTGGETMHADILMPGG